MPVAPIYNLYFHVILQIAVNKVKISICIFKTIGGQHDFHVANTEYPWNFPMFTSFYWGGRDWDMVSPLKNCISLKQNFI